METGSRLGFLTIATPDGKAVFVGGEKGVMLRSLDRGVTWAPLQTGAVDTVFGIRAFGNGKVIAMSGTNMSPVRPRFLSSPDAGETWAAPLELSARFLESPDGTTIFASGLSYGILKSTDGGRTWSSCLAALQEIRRFAMGEEGTLVAVTSEYPTRNHAWVSRDGGGSWDHDSLPFDYGMTLLPSGENPLAFTVSGDRYRYAQGGWTGPTAPRLRAGGGISAADGEAAWLVGGDQAHFLQGSGATWITTRFPSDHTLHCVSAAGRDTVYAGGYRTSPSQEGVLLRSFDRGGTWQNLEAGGNYPVKGLQAFDGRTLFVAGGNQIRTTLDGGTTWRIFAPSGANGLNQVAAASRRIAYACCDPESRILRTADSGSTWEPVSSVSLSRALTASGEETVFNLRSSSQGDQVHKSGDGGRTWIELPILGNRWISSVHTPIGRPGLVLATSYPGRLFASLDTGRTWAEEDMGFQGRPDFLSYGGGETVFAVGQADVVLIRRESSTALRLSGGPTGILLPVRKNQARGPGIHGAVPVWTWGSAGKYHDTRGRTLPKTGSDR